RVAPRPPAARRPAPRAPHGASRRHQTVSRTSSASPTDQGARTDMGVPKRKVAHARQMDRRSHLALTLPKLVECPHCHEPKLPHKVCPACGWKKAPKAIDLKPAGGSSAGEESA